MSKTKKTAFVIGIVLCALALVLGCLWFFRQQPVSLGKLLPDEEWVGMELEQMLPYNLEGNLLFEEPPMEDILYQLQILRVSRDTENQLGDDEAFRITLYKTDAWPTVLYVKSNGQVHLCDDMQSGEWEYYQGAEALYVYLSNLSQTLSVA